ncbi:MAG: hypothetical protein H0T56_08155 [Pseudaminobacter sp.]|nr:hypothetical protein [Pseudaminobacter sp.]
MADRIFQRPVQSTAHGGRGRRDDQADGRGGRPGFGGLPEQENGPAGFPRPAMQPSRRGQIEQAWVAVDLQKNRRKLLQTGRFLGNPQCVGKFWRLRDQKFVRRKAAQGCQPGRVRKSRFAKGLADADPQEGRPAFSFDCGMSFHDQSGKSEGEACGGSGTVHHAAMDFG